MVTKTENQDTTTTARAGSQAYTRQVAQPGPMAEMMGLHNSLGNRAVGQVLQPKLKVNQPGDKYEREADRIADLVMRMPDSAMQDVSRSPATVQRKCAACESGGTSCPKCHEEEEKIQRKPLATQITPLVQRRENSAAAPEVTPQVASQINSLRGGGQPLPRGIRTLFEPRFGVDFSGVRIHTGSRAAQAASAIKARAFTIGRDVVFDTGQYSPHEIAGRYLVAHELSHVVQQKNIEQIQRFTTDDCNDEDVEIIKPADFLAYKMVKQVIKVLDSYITEAYTDGKLSSSSMDRINPVLINLFSRFFNHDQPPVRIIRSVYKSIFKTLRDDDYQYECWHGGSNCNGSTLAWVGPIWTDIHLCMNKLKNSSAEEVAETIIHEMSHYAADTGDEAYCTATECPDSLSYYDAIANGDSYSYFAYGIYKSSLTNAIATAVPSINYNAGPNDILLGHHIIKDGETLPEIAIQYYNSVALWALIYQENNLRSMTLTPGQRLAIPNPNFAPTSSVVLY